MTVQPLALIAASTSGTVLIELGAVLVLLGVLGRVAGRVGLPAIPLFLVAGLMLGEGGLVPLDASEDFVRIGADLGVVILLLLLGLEYTPADLQRGLRSNWRAGVLDVVSSSVPGLLLGLLLGWGFLASLVLAGITYVSSSGIIAHQLATLDRIGNRETPVILTILVIEDLVMAVFLPLIGVLILGLSPLQGGLSIAAALALVVVVLMVASRFSHPISRWLRLALTGGAAAHDLGADVAHRRARRAVTDLGRGRGVPARSDVVRQRGRAWP